MVLPNPGAHPRPGLLLSCRVVCQHVQQLGNATHDLSGPGAPGTQARRGFRITLPQAEALQVVLRELGLVPEPRHFALERQARGDAGHPLHLRVGRQPLGRVVPQRTASTIGAIAARCLSRIRLWHVGQQQQGPPRHKHVQPASRQLLKPRIQRIKLLRLRGDPALESWPSLPCRRTCPQPCPQSSEARSHHVSCQRVRIALHRLVL
mmetsp:Transcript_78620/g.230706  ORF Transcript_78620/g.230706 Transcript_78620/m.230706 type:complete len:207 (+) Transcript_78620:504-1124(+)